MLKQIIKSFIIVTFTFQLLFTPKAIAKDFSDYSFLIVEGNNTNLNDDNFWNFIRQNQYSGIEVDINETEGKIVCSENNKNFNLLLQHLKTLMEDEESAIIPVFLNFQGNISILDSIIKNSEISTEIFYLPRGETWPSIEYLVQANRRILFFVSGKYEGESRILHQLNNYVLRIYGNDIASNSSSNRSTANLNHELLMVDELEKLPVRSAPNTLSNNVIPDYVNYLLENWTKFGKRPNFLFIGKNYMDYNFTVSQLSSFNYINGTVKYAGKILEKVYWKNPEVTITNGKFSFPIRGGEEITISPFAPGYTMTPQQIVVTGEMEVPESYSIIAAPDLLSEGITGSFSFENEVTNTLDPTKTFEGENYSYTQDIERGNVLKLPENSNINLGNPENYGFRNSSFTVSCFVKFTEILEFGDNAIIGNYESGYRKGLHLILRSGHPYFGLWANDYVSEVVLNPDIWYHLTWRYIIETGEQSIFLNGRNIGSSDGHPPFSGTGDIHIGSALSSGASLRGYIDDIYFWNRPLGIEEINRLALNENIDLEKINENPGIINQFTTKVFLGILILLVIVFSLVFLFKKKRIKKTSVAIHLPESGSANQIRLFGRFVAIDKDKNDITEFFTPKVRELLLFILISTSKNGNGASVQEINEQLWTGISSKKVANNRAVTLNKLRRILMRMEGIEIAAENGYLKAKTKSPFFCDFIEAYLLCQVSGEMTTQQLEAFFNLVKKGRFLKEMNWNWLDEIRGLTGNQVIDNLLKLASLYIKENKLEKIEAISKRILDYDDLSEEAVYLQILVLQSSQNSRLVKFNFDSFCNKYKENMGEDYPLNFEKFIKHYAQQFKD